MPDTSLPPTGGQASEKRDGTAAWRAQVRLTTALLTRAAEDARRIRGCGVPAVVASADRLADAARAAWDAANDGDRWDGQS